MWDLPGQGLEPVSPALAGGFLTTVPPGKSTWGTFCFPRIVSLVLGSLLCTGIVCFLKDCLADELRSLSTIKMMGSSNCVE